MTPRNTILLGDVIDRLKELDSDSIDCLITSPPYYNLRDYKVEGQLGSEATHLEYLDKLFSIFDEVKRVVKPTATVWVNLGDSYNGNKKGNTNGEDGNVVQKPGVNDMGVNKRKFGKILNKSLLGIPNRFMTGMVDRGWACINEIIWYKRNAMPSSGKEKFSPDYEKIFLFTKNTSPIYYVNKKDFRLKLTRPKDLVEGVDWYYKFANPTSYIKKQKPIPATWKIFFPHNFDWLFDERSYLQKRSYWIGRDYYFATQYRPLAESTLKEIQKAYNGKGRKDYEANGVQNPSDAKRSMLKSFGQYNVEPIEDIAEGMGINTGIKFGGNKAEGYGNATYSGKAWVPQQIREFRIDTRPGDDTGNGKSGTEIDPNAGLHNSDLSTKRQAIVREIDGELFGGLKRTVWDITTRGYPGAHFATFPEQLVIEMIKPGCAEQVCIKCGIPRLPIYEPSPEYAKLLGKGWHDHANDAEMGQEQEKNLPSAKADYRIVGSSDCGCNTGFKRGLVIDPFMGAGTVGLVAAKLGFDWLGIEIKQEYIDMANKRIEPFRCQ